jgi:hypothetical protein
LLVGYLGGAYKKQGQVGFRRVDRARGLIWRSGVVLHDTSSM